MSATEHTPVQAVESLEIERKYEAAVDQVLPSREQFAAAGFEATDPVTFTLRARYFDTPAGELAALGVAVRCREGGKDAGWHLKQRGEHGVREVAWPPSELMPEELRSEILRRIGAAAEHLAPLAELNTERTVVVLRSTGADDGADDGTAAVEIADDRVRAYSRPDDTHRAWREWEAELLPGAYTGGAAGAALPGAALLDAVEPVLLAAGAEPSLSFAKIARASGQLVNAARAKGASAELIAALEALDAADQEAARRLEV